MNLDECESFFDAALASECEADFCHAIAPLFDAYQIISLDFGRGSIFWRARIVTDEIYKNLRDLDYPPPQYARQGRLNDHGEPCFYVASRKETALAEVNASEGQLIQLAGFRIKNETPIRLAVIGEYSNVQKNGYMHFLGKDPGMGLSQILNSMPKEEALVHLYIDRFFAHILADPDASKNGYLRSRALGQAIHSRGATEGIVFPSVKDRGGFNVAIKSAPSDRSFHNVCCIVAQPAKPRRFGLVDFSIIKSAQKLDDEWNFIWLEDRKPEIVGMYNLNKEEFDIASAAPHDRNGLLKMLHPRSRKQ